MKVHAHNGDTALHVAAGEGHVAAIEVLVSGGAELDGVDAEGQTALYHAALGGHARVCSLLLARGADVKVHALDGDTALHTAALEGNVSVIEVLVRGGAELDDAANTYHATPLLMAVKKQHLDAVTKLLELGASANVCEFLGNTPLSSGIMKEYEPIVCALLPHTDLRLLNCSGLNAFHLKALGGQLSCFKLLLPHFLDDVDLRSVQARNVSGYGILNAGVSYKCTALLLACDGGHHRIVRELLANGASRTAVDSNQRTPLMRSAYSGHLACLIMVLGRPGDYKLSAAEMDARDASGGTALYWAAYKGNRACCAVLIAAGADLNATDCEGDTPLEAARIHHADDEQLIALLEGSDAAAGVPPPQLCDGCGIPSSQAPGGKLRACSACQSAAFCSTACLTQAWPGHRAECQRIQAANEERNRIRVINPSKPSAQGSSAPI